MKKAVFHSIMALVMVLGLTIAMAVPVAGKVPPAFPVTEKEVVWDATDGHPEGVYLEHQNVEYLLKVTNDTDHDLEVEFIRDVFAYGTAAEEDSVWDNVLGDWVDHDPEDLPTTFSIPSGDEWSSNVTHQIPSKDVVGDTVENRILVLGEAEEEYTGNIPKTVQVIKPEIELEKTVTPTVAGVGDPVEYTFTITNTGDWPLENIVLVDPFLELSYDVPEVLGPGEDYELDPIPYTIQEGDLPLTNEATVTAIAQGFDEDTFGPEASPTAVVENSDTATVRSPLLPVGGSGNLVSRLALLAPWIVLAGLIAGAAVFFWSRRAHGRV